MKKLFFIVFFVVSNFSNVLAMDSSNMNDFVNHIRNINSKKIDIVYACFKIEDTYRCIAVDNKDTTWRQFSVFGIYTDLNLCFVSCDVLLNDKNKKK
ncbi:MAG: hypothetical protein RMJ67_07850 [Elusimicrobiota bacterium]|nr:hypothetical protein [Endomicrobiia bacterium]MDW8166406.1 hypothetical protein [Elusimicrobiota bacterium]